MYSQSYITITSIQNISLTLQRDPVLICSHLPFPQFLATGNLLSLCFCLFCINWWLFTQSCLTLWNPVDLKHAWFPRQEFVQTHVHWVDDAIWPSHPLLSPSLLTLNLSQHQSFPMSWLYQVAKSIGTSASVLPMNIQGWFPLGLTDLISLISKGALKGLLQHLSSKASIFDAQPFYGPTLPS